VSGKSGTGKSGTGKSGTGKNGTGKNGTGKNGTGKNGTNGEVGKNGILSILKFEVGCLGWRYWFGNGDLSMGFGNILHKCAIFSYFSICALITSAIIACATFTCAVFN